MKKGDLSPMRDGSKCAVFYEIKAFEKKIIKSIIRLLGCFEGYINKTIVFLPYRVLKIIKYRLLITFFFLFFYSCGAFTGGSNNLLNHTNF